MQQTKTARRWSRRSLLTAAVGLTGALVLTACGGGAAATPTSAPAAKATTAPAPTTAPAASPASAASPAAVTGSPAAVTSSPASTSASPQAAASPAAKPQVGAKVNANTASVADLQRAFEAAGISGAARWAREVEEYRPYPTDDPNFAKLRRELAKYNPGPGVVDQIIATLSL